MFIFKIPLLTVYTLIYCLQLKVRVHVLHTDWVHKKRYNIQDHIHDLYMYTTKFEIKTNKPLKYAMHIKLNSNINWIKPYLVYFFYLREYFVLYTLYEIKRKFLRVFLSAKFVCACKVCNVFNIKNSNLIWKKNPTIFLPDWYLLEYKLLISFLTMVMIMSTEACNMMHAKEFN